MLSDYEIKATGTNVKCVKFEETTRRAGRRGEAAGEASNAMPRMYKTRAEQDNPVVAQTVKHADDDRQRLNDVPVLRLLRLDLAYIALSDPPTISSFRLPPCVDFGHCFTRCACRETIPQLRRAQNAAMLAQRFTPLKKGQARFRQMQARRTYARERSARLFKIIIYSPVVHKLTSER